MFASPENRFDWSSNASQCGLLHLGRGLDDVVGCVPDPGPVEEKLRPDHALLGQHRDQVVADGHEDDAGILELLMFLLQLNQLLPTERSPTRRPMEHDGDLAGLRELVERPFLPRLVLEGERRGLLPNVQTDLLLRGRVCGPRGCANQ